MSEVPKCPDCRRPLQKGRSTCIYCGRELSQGESEQLLSALGEAELRRRAETAGATLQARPPALVSPLLRIVIKIFTVMLALAAALLLSWVSEWNPGVVAVALAFFAWPIWMVLRRG